MRSANLLAVLDILPLDVFDVHVWELMSPKARGSLRLTCRQSKRLVDLILTTAKLCLYQAGSDPNHPLGRVHWWWVPSPEEQQAVETSKASERAALQQSMQSVSAFAASLPRFTTLELTSWQAEADLASALSLVAAATPGRISRLRLGTKHMAATSLQAVRTALPCLQELQLEICRPEWGPSLGLTGEVFAPLNGSQLKRLEVGRDVVCSRDVMRSLGGLDMLVHLSLSVSNFDPAHLHLLSGLRRLRSCHIGYLETGATLVQAACLFHSTGLVSFKVDVEHTGLSSNERPSAEVAAAVALLGGLEHLEILDLGCSFLAGDAETAAILRCERLQELRLGGLWAEAPSPGHLPLLHTLWLGQDEGQASLFVTPYCLLEALLPLLPMPSLTSLNGKHGVQIDISLHGADAADTALLAADLRHAMRHLAAAPRLQLGGSLQHELAFSSSETRGGWDSNLLSLAQLADALLPWAGSLARLHLTKMNVPSEGWEALQARLPGLSHLHLGSCNVGRQALVTIAEGWTTLRRLSLSNCVSPGERGWVDMAEHRAHPLLLNVDVGLKVVSRCQAVQEECFGEQHIKWVMAAP